MQLSDIFGSLAMFLLGEGERAVAVVGGEQEETDDVERAIEGLAGASLSCGAEQLLNTDSQGISLPIESLS